MADGPTHASHRIEEAFWIVVGRPATSVEIRDEARAFAPETERVLLLRLLSSAEFSSQRTTWLEGRQFRDAVVLEEGLQGLGSPEAFVARAYECLLGRPADRDGLQHYVTGLGAGNRRTDVLRALVLSDEFASRFRELAPDNGFVPRDVQLCELANPAKWDNDEWLATLRDLGLDADKRSMHRKPYEFTQLVYGSRRLGALREDSTILSVGAGHELLLYWLANHARQVVATDMYEGVWQGVQGREGDPNVVARPEDYAPFPYRRDHLTFLKMDGLHLGLATGVFDLAYSLSSIEHFGSLAAASAAVAEMGRVLKPGGILALATEYVLGGPPHDETFQPDEFAQLMAQPGLELVQPIDVDVFRRYDYRAIDLYRNPYQAPHMVVRFGDTVFTTVMVFLRKR